MGRHAVAAVLQHPDLELVGALVYSDAKAGRDVGETCGIDKIGVTTAVTGFIYPKSVGRRVVERLESTRAEGGTSFHGTGIEPGWAAEVLPLTMSALFQRVDSLLVQELLDYSTYGSADMLFDVMGFGKAPDAPVPMADPSVAGVTFRLRSCSSPTASAPRSTTSCTSGRSRSPRRPSTSRPAASRPGRSRRSASATPH